MQHGQAASAQRHETFIRHPIRATVHEAAHLRQIADEGASPATPAILAGVVLAFIVPLVSMLILLDFVIGHFS